jgi:type IV fimbrial biogenesis protein FimT
MLWKRFRSKGRAVVSFRIQQQGFTLVELMVTITIAAILLTIGVPSLTSFFDRQKVVAAAEEAYGYLQEARSEALSRNSTIFLAAFSSSGNWGYGFSNTDNCEPSVSDSCVISVGGSDVERAWLSTQHSDVSMAISGSIGMFEGIRGFYLEDDGTSPEDLEWLFSIGERSMLVTVNPLGRISICSPSASVGGYIPC